MAGAGDAGESLSGRCFAIAAIQRLIVPAAAWTRGSPKSSVLRQRPAKKDGVGPASQPAFDVFFFSICGGRQN